ncbi:MAG: DinB family protein [Acidobacteria bacterium]|nr:DinB family protein [Acidobacteriota bacterium]
MSQSAIAKPLESEYAPYYGQYVALVPEGKIVEILEQQLEASLALWQTIAAEQGGYRYAPDKWSIKELLGHLTDSERVFAFRVLRFGRNDAQPIEGFEQDDYIANADFDNQSLSALVKEFVAVRQATIYLLRHLPEAAWTRSGVASNNSVSVRALAYIIAGHELHHLNILRERYL